MYALDNQSGVDVMPPLKAQLKQPSNPLWFTEGGNGVAPSYPGADWFNVVQAELLNVLKAAQVTPSKDTLTQLASAVQKIAETAIAQSTKVDKGGDTMTGVLKAKDVLLTSDDGAVKSLSNVIQALSHLFTGNVQGFTDKMNALGTSGTTPLGITYNRDNPNAWYLCLGPLFGGFIIQGGSVIMLSTNISITPPLHFNQNSVLYCDAVDISADLTVADRDTTMQMTYGLNVLKIITKVNLESIKWLLILK
ncbi:hypothetical protein [Gallibacterium anatis]|uniref:Tail fiber protein n=1 Tax=Gallibacterium anatis TaxID=750 RepID=A0A0A2XAS8_9PAST|nr:hypothetical protein [Gallibacterium anatis]KGQ29168.1 hypothetical protein JP32_11595 [Gallibacterium anatis]